MVESRDARQRAMKARQADRAALQRLEAREERIREEILAAAAAAGGGNYNGATGGLLAAPVNGPVTSPFGYRRHPIYGYWGLHNGTDFGVGCGSPVFAGAAGTVTSTYYDEVYGNRLYLSIGTVNGANLTLVYNHMSGYNVSERRPGRPRRRRGVRRHHRLVDRLPHALHGAAQRQSGRSRCSTLTRDAPGDVRMAREQGRKLIAQNKKARHDFHIEDTFEAGLVLQGTEVKSLRMGRATIGDGFVDIDGHEAWLHGVHIPEYTQGTWTNHAARRKRKLLLHRTEIDKIERKVNERGLTVIPLALYFVDGRAKIEIGLAKGKKSWDKRHALAERQADREKEQAVGRRLKGMDD